MKKILILGGGFAGIEAAIYLRKYKYEVTLISNRDYFYIYPTSIWVPTSNVRFEKLCVPLDKLSKVHGFSTIIDEVKEIKTKDNKVICSNNTYDFEYLIIAIGNSKIKHKGNENFLSICAQPEQSLQLQDKLNALISKGSGKIAIGFGGNPIDPSNIRGGPAFELLFNIHNKLKKLKIVDNFELSFFAPMDEPGAKMGKYALNMMNMVFKKLKIKTYFGKKIKEFQKDAVIFEDDSKLLYDFTMFIPAGSGHEVFKNSDLPLSQAGMVLINDYCEVVTKDNDIVKNVYAIGDNVDLKGPKWKAKQGHLAEVMARNVAYNIKHGNVKKYSKYLNILCLMDGGNGATFVFRDDKNEKMIPLPIIGHYLKRIWGWYCRNSKLNKIPRIPGM